MGNEKTQTRMLERDMSTDVHWEAGEGDWLEGVGSEERGQARAGARRFYSDGIMRSI
jgi:hypothetical protein